MKPAKTTKCIPSTKKIKTPATMDTTGTTGTLGTIKQLFLTTLRDKHISTREFRENAHAISHIIAQESLTHIETEEVKVETPIAATTGIKIKPPIMLVPILRAGMVMLEPFLHYYHNAKIGVVGLKRDEKTAIAKLYYENIPRVTKLDTVIMLDPMISTGGTGIQTIEILLEKNVQEKNIIFAAIICSTKGIQAIKKKFPKITIIQAGIDEKLNKHKYIVPGLGDFGDRYYGTE